MAWSTISLKLSRDMDALGHTCTKLTGAQDQNAGTAEWQTQQNMSCLSVKDGAV